jgi:8-oxo-dGTP diphosphatase
MNSRTIASVLVNYDDEYLFIRQNKPGGAYPETLHIPGGGLEPGETPLDAAIREIREEVGLDIINIRPVDFDWDVVPYKGEDTLLIFLRFIAESTSRKALPASDAKEVLWISRAELGQQQHNPPSVRLLKKLNLI